MSKTIPISDAQADAVFNSLRVATNTKPPANLLHDLHMMFQNLSSLHDLSELLSADLNVTIDTLEKEITKVKEQRADHAKFFENEIKYLRTEYDAKIARIADIAAKTDNHLASTIATLTTVKNHFFQATTLGETTQTDVASLGNIIPATNKEGN